MLTAFLSWIICWICSWLVLMLEMWKIWGLSSSFVALCFWFIFLWLTNVGIFLEVMMVHKMSQTFCSWLVIAVWIYYPLLNHMLVALPDISMMMQIKYVSGSYDAPEGFQALDKAISEHEFSKNSTEGSSRRLFYLALPPSVYPPVCKMIKYYCMNKCMYRLWNYFRLLIPFLNNWSLIEGSSTIINTPIWASRDLQGVESARAHNKLPNQRN